MTFDFETRREFAKKRFTTALDAHAAFRAALDAGLEQLLLTGSVVMVFDGQGGVAVVDALQAFSEAANKIVEG